MTTIGSIGIGLFVLVIVWIVALIVFVVGIKLQSNIAWIALASATCLTVLLLIIPTEKQFKTVEEPELKVTIYFNMLLMYCTSFIFISGQGLPNNLQKSSAGIPCSVRRIWCPIVFHFTLH